MKNPAVEDALSYGLLAVRLRLITSEMLCASLDVWNAKRSRLLGEILVDQGVLRKDQRDWLDSRWSAMRAAAFHDDLPTACDDDSSGPSERTTRPKDFDEDTEPLQSPASEFATGAHPAVHHEETLPMDSDLNGSTGLECHALELRYQIVKPLARGGLGEVFIAADRELNRHVALKLIQPQHATCEQSRARFVFEAEVTGVLEHPGIVPVHGFGQFTDGRPYYAMRLIKGETLKDAIRAFHTTESRGTGTTEWLRRLRALLRRFMDVCDVIGYAHSQGVLHRDIKPSNILLGSHGETLVVDWGLAKHMDRKEDAIAPAAISNSISSSGTQSGLQPTLPGTAVGTPQYMSPEQAAGRLDRIGPVSDVYGLGATLYQILTGLPPFDGEDLRELMRRVYEGNPMRPRQLNPAIPGVLEAICLHALAKSPKARYQTPRLLAEDIERWLADEPVSIYREPPSTRLTRWGRRHRTFATGIGVLLISATLGLMAGALLLGQANFRTEKQRQLADNAAHSLAHQLYVNRINLAQRAWEDSNIRRTLDLLDATRPEGPNGPDLRGFEWYYLQRLCHTGYQSLAAHTSPVWSVAYHPNSRLLATGGDDHTLIIWDLDRSAPRHKLTGHTDGIRAIAFSPDGSVVASASHDGSVRMWDTPTGRFLRALSHDKSNLNALVFTPDGHAIITAGTDKTIRIWDSESGELRHSLTGHEGAIFGLAIASDGKKLVSASIDRTLRVWALTDEPKCVRTLESEVVLIGVAFSPDGQTIATVGDESFVRLWDAHEGRDLGRLVGHTQWVRTVAFNHDGTMLASAGSDQTVRVYDVRTLQPMLTLRGHGDDVRGLAFSPDGSQLASASIDRTVKIWNLESRQRLRILSGTSEVGRSVAFRPGRFELSSSGFDGTIRTWDLVNGRHLIERKGHTDGVFDLAYSADGKWLASASRDGTVRLWDSDRDTPPRILMGNPDKRDFGNALFCVTFSPDSKRLATAGADKTIWIWNIETSQVVQRLKAHTDYVWSLAYSSDGKLLASAGADRCTRLWQTETGVLLRTFPQEPAAIWGLAFSPDCKRLATANEDRTIRLWDVASGKIRRLLNGHTGQVRSVAFSSDGTRLVSASLDTTVRLWDAESGQELLTLTGNVTPLWDVAFSLDDHRIAASSQDGAVILWESVAP